MQVSFSELLFSSQPACLLSCVCLVCQESYFKARANAPIIVEDEEAEVDYDSDGYPIISERSKVIDPLPPIDHSAVSN